MLIVLSDHCQVCTWGDVDCEGDGFSVLTGAELPSVLIGLPGGVAT